MWLLPGDAAELGHWATASVRAALFNRWATGMHRGDSSGRPPFARRTLARWMGIPIPSERFVNQSRSGPDGSVTLHAERRSAWLKSLGVSPLPLPTDTASSVDSAKEAWPPSISPR